jgi:DNA-binding winged helix-turn-helix (wHTH) protein
MLFQFNNFNIDTDRRELEGPDRVIHVEPQVFDLLVYFAQNPNRVISKNQLIEKIWKGRVISDAALNSRINLARRAIGDTGKRQALIRTIQRRGFLFAAEVTMRAGTQLSSAADSNLFGPPQLPLPDKPSIAVLPFQNLSGHPQQEYFADGVVEDIITPIGDKLST